LQFEISNTAINSKSHGSRVTGHRKVPSNGFGKSADMRWRSTLPCKFERTTSASPQNSHKICRHDPHGGVSTSVSATTATASNPRSPSEIALKTATRSAHRVKPYVAFSTLQPVKICPDLARTAAPTRKLEYGACACSRAVRAAAINFSQPASEEMLCSLMADPCSCAELRRAREPQNLLSRARPFPSLPR